MISFIHVSFNRLKNNLLRNSIAFYLLLLLTCILTGCNHREFLYEAPSRRIPVEVIFDWSIDPDANPSEMTVYFFRLDSNRVITYDFKGKDGGSAILSPGIYAAICHNADSDRHGFVGSNAFDEFGLRLNDNRNASSFQSNLSYLRISDERIAHSPDYMWVGVITMFEIKAIDEIPDRSVQTVVFEMQSVVSHYTFHILNPINFNKSISVNATLSGMASTIHPGRGMTGQETVTHLFEMSPTPDGNLFGEILTFGHCSGKVISSRSDDDSKPHILSIFATMSDGQRWTSVHDVTEQIHGSSTQDCVIRLDSVPFPKPTGGGGFNPTVGGWTGSQEIIGM